MYQPSTQFPQITTRESWSQLIGVYDDATGDPINLTNTQGQGTFAVWTVEIAATLYGTTLISTTSQSSLTIGNGQFTATLLANLAIASGQYVTFIAQNNTTNWMQGQVVSYDPIAGTVVFEIVAVSIELEIRRAQKSGYGYGTGLYDWGAPILTASIGNGITIIDQGVFQVYFNETQFRSLGSGMHSVAATLTSADGIDTRQLFLGRLPVLSGMVTN